MTIENFCATEYERLYQIEYDKLLALYEQGGPKGKRSVNEKKKDEFRIAARKYAIESTLLTALTIYPNTEPAYIWDIIYVQHIFNFSHEDDLEKIKKIISADQSWKKSSGHALESVIKKIANPLLEPHALRIFLQKDLSLLLKQNKVSNPDRDITFLKEKIVTNIFDLYISIVEPDGTFKVFGCIQSKTSVRDRVTRDREPSIIAMNHFFLSIAFILNGAFLRLPKFINMVNGGNHEFQQNGWHAAYVFSNDVAYDANRIFIVDLKMEKLVDHMIKASKDWQANRQWFDATWKPVER